ncbi:MAG: nuclear transport factor 2 family protein [Thermoguttaceae bacterium]|jgi:ketosteroid isomerase-like protein
MSEQNLNIVMNLYGAVARGEFPLDSLDPQVEWTEANVPDLWFGGTHHGPDAVLREVMGPTSEHVDGFRLQCDEFLDAGDRIIVTGRFLGRGKETGVGLDAAFAHIWTLRDDKVTRFQGYTDTANWLYALYRIQVEHPVGV